MASTFDPYCHLTTLRRISSMYVIQDTSSCVEPLVTKHRYVLCPDVLAAHSLETICAIMLLHVSYSKSHQLQEKSVFLALY